MQKLTVDGNAAHVNGLRELDDPPGATLSPGFRVRVSQAVDSQ